MPTKPLETILYRELSKAEANDVIGIASPLLQELVNYSTNAWARCATSASGGLDEDLAVLILYLHMIEMTDGVEVLISQSCPVPAQPLLRSSFEALLSIEYILDADYTRRSLSWLVGYTHNRLKYYRSLELSAPKDQSLRQALRDHKSEPIRNLPLPSQTEVQKAITNLQDFLNKPHIQAVEAEFQNRKNPRWYSLFGGPSRLYRLARDLNRQADYLILYRRWSSIGHAHDLSRFLTRSPEGDPAIERLRDPREIKQVTIYATTFLLNGTRLVLGKFRPGEDLSEWYKREVRERFLRMTK